MSYEIGEEPVSLKNSLLRLLVGECIGSGASRRVYEALGDNTIVYKLEHTGRSFHNQTEWLIWKEVKDWPIADWFSPCLDIDGYGNVLIQRRTKPFQSQKEFDAALTRTRAGLIPDHFSDIHYGNFGLLDDRVVCHDYGYHNFFAKGARAMSVAAGYITDDLPEEEPPHDVAHEGGQLVLDI